MWPPLIATISPFRIARRANRPLPSIGLRRTCVLGDRYEAGMRISLAFSARAATGESARPRRGWATSRERGGGAGERDGLLEAPAGGQPHGERAVEGVARGRRVHDRDRKGREMERGDVIA